MQSFWHITISLELLGICPWTILGFHKGSEFDVGFHPIHNHLFRICLRIASNPQRVIYINRSAS